MKQNLVYKYAQGDLLEQPHDYQYSAYNGINFLRAWENHRKEILTSLGEPQVPPEASANPENKRSVHSHLENLMYELQINFPQDSGIKSKLDLWTKKFEISKRLFSQYDEHLKPVDKTKYHDMAAYVRYAEIMEKAYQLSGKLPYLNVLLKIMDTLIACRDRLDAWQKSRLAWLISREVEYVRALGKKRGVAI